MVATWKPKQFHDKIKGHKQSILCLYSPLGPDGNLLYSCSADGWIYIWDVVSREIYHKIQLETPKQSADCRQFSAVALKDNVVYGGMVSGQIFSWNIRSGEIIGRYDGHQTRISHIARLNERVLMSSAVNEASFTLWDTMSSQMENRFLLDGPVSQLVHSNQTIFAVHQRKYLSIIDYEKTKLLETVQIAENQYCITLLATQNWLIVQLINGHVNFYRLPWTANQHTDWVCASQSWINCAIDHNNMTIIGCQDQTIKFLKVSQKGVSLVDSFEAHESAANCLQLCSSMLYSASCDCSIRSWDLKQIYRQQKERTLMEREDMESRKWETYTKHRGKKKKKPIKRRK